jgi:hypothetical protein
MDSFRSGPGEVLVATDIAARGIDVSQISHVINYDMPDTAEAYTHRIGRTGRMEKRGHGALAGHAGRSAHGAHDRAPAGVVSIHAPRGGSDLLENGNFLVVYRVSIHAPRGGSDRATTP